MAFVTFDDTFDTSDESDVEEENTGEKETVFYNGPAYGRCKFEWYTITDQSLVVRKDVCCRRKYRQTEMKYVTDASIVQNCMQRRAHAGLIKFFTVDPLYPEPVYMLLPNAEKVFKKVMAKLKSDRVKFAKSSKARVDNEQLIYQGEGYETCPCQLCNLLCPVSYKITSEEVVEQRLCCAIACGGKPSRAYPGLHYTCAFVYKWFGYPMPKDAPGQLWAPCCSCACSNEVNFLSVRRIFQVVLRQGCCTYCCCCCPESGDIQLYTTDDSAGNEFVIRVPDKAVKIFQKLRRRTDLETAMLDKLKVARVMKAAVIE